MADRVRREGRDIFYRLDDEDADYPGEEVLLARVPEDVDPEEWERRIFPAGLDVANVCGHGYVRPTGTIYCDLPTGHEGHHTAGGIGSWARLEGDDRG